MDLQSEEMPLMRALVGATVQNLPGSWSTAVLDVTENAEGEGASYQTSLTSSDDPPFATPSADVFSAIRELFLLHGRRRTRLKGISLSLRFDGDRWRAAADYRYDT